MNKEFSQLVAVFLLNQVEKIEQGIVIPKNGENPIICHAAHFEITPQIVNSPAGTLIDRSHTLYISLLKPEEADKLKFKRSVIIQLNQHSENPVAIGSIRFPARVNYLPALNSAMLIIEAVIPTTA